MKLLYPSADKIVANSSDTASDIKKYIRRDIENLITINNPIFNNRIYDLSNERSNLDDFYQLQKPIIISVGRFFPQKNFSFLIKSFVKVKKEFNNASLVILGDGPLKNQLFSLAKELKVEKDVHFLGFVDNPYKYLKNSDVFVLSSLYEGFGNVIVEALAVGTPVVATHCPGGPHEILQNGKFGILVPVNNEDAMANAIIQTLLNKKDSSWLIERAKDFSICEIANKYLKHL